MPLSLREGKNPIGIFNLFKGMRESYNNGMEELNRENVF